ncbi:MAG: type II toxin-antitoxin system Phd/YefM family antitoxin [Candidatus Ratteibacteria bacterium]|nr:type II toxin-antitoxin system Phd/YefM family antitoxin [Candidatus Ratteibacteria bacterium]
MINNVTVKELRPELHNVIQNIDTKLERYIITKHGKPVAVMMSIDDYESLLETLEILSDKEAVKRIKRAKRQIKEGKTISIEELKEKTKKLNV